MPWERIHADFAGPIFEHTFFLIVDAHSKWLEVYPMKTTTTKKTVECLRDSFARFGLPRVLVSDNGSQFTSYEFQRFMQRKEVKHKTSAPFKPSSNGQAGRYIRPVGDQVQENIIPIIHQRFPSAEVRKNNSNIQHAETAEDISKDPNKELGSSSVQGVPSIDVAVPDLSQSLAKETVSETRSPPVRDRPFHRRSGRIRRPPERLVL
ncbi:uncharacterized protein K02A2.6 [Trichonephila clavata]|uniref:Uncharacterized protein K02A2.6 n=1 Tax=Trichonephila clavata TaxID=2740835 RepID=A0A8X6F6Z3_TRICU|nr:uncharacterized protein K02A2.6 [Trichonephila clavata]